jgi:hypothetical protein
MSEHRDHGRDFVVEGCDECADEAGYPPSEPVRLCDAKRGRYRCTLLAGHEDRHEAGGTGGVVFARWQQRVVR